MFATRPLRAGVAVLLAASILPTLPSTARATSVVATSAVATSWPAAQQRSPHAGFDDTRGPARPGIAAGGPADTPLARRGGLARDARATTAQVLGFAQAGEVASGQWRQDLRLGLLDTIAYFGLDIAADGSITTQNNFGYQGWRSRQATDLIDAAHAAGARVVVTITAFDNATIASVTGSEANRQRCIAAVIAELQQRGGDGVNVDFEGYDASVAPNFTTFIAELQQGLRSAVPGASFLTVDVYASSAQGGTMFDITSLAPHLDAFDVMAYEFTQYNASNAGPTSPMNGYRYTVTQTVADYLKLVAPSQVILGVPYYGNKWSVSSPQPQAPVVCCNHAADTYNDALADVACGQQAQTHFDATFAEPWATWWSPASGDPCGGNLGSWRELYYEDAAALRAKYDLVTLRGLRGIGIWALGMDSGHAELWQAIATGLVGHGYWLVAADGGIFPFGAASGYGSTGGTHLNRPIVAMAPSPGGNGYWLVAADGGVFPFGPGATGYGSTGGTHLNQPIVAADATPTGRGYWLVARDGGVFPFGDAVGYGSTGGIHLNRPIVGMALTPTGRGYWLVAADGGIFPFGDATGFGSTGSGTLNRPMVGMAASASGHGYWLVAADGGIFPFGDAGGYGSTGATPLNSPIVGMAASQGGHGYWLVAGDGGIFPFGDARGYGSMGGTPLNQPVVGMAATP
jgi:spore germination protein YaaH